jgi:UrcA family protein
LGGQLLRRDKLLVRRGKATAQHQEIHMYIKTVAISARLLVCAATVIGTLAEGIAGASEHTVTVTVHVSSRGLDINKPPDAQTFYRRIQHAAEVVCTHGNRVDLAPVNDYKGCYENALANAIRSLKMPLLTRMYLENHTLKEAEAVGIDLPSQLAAK